MTVMLRIPNPKRLMVGYLLGAYMTSITLGLVIAFALPGSSTESTSKHTIGPVEDIVVGLLLWAIGRFKSSMGRRGRTAVVIGAGLPACDCSRGGVIRLV